MQSLGGNGSWLQSLDPCLPSERSGLSSQPQPWPSWAFGGGGWTSRWKIIVKSLLPPVSLSHIKNTTKQLFTLSPFPYLPLSPSITLSLFPNPLFPLQRVPSLGRCVHLTFVASTKPNIFCCQENRGAKTKSRISAFWCFFPASDSFHWRVLSKKGDWQPFEVICKTLPRCSSDLHTLYPAQHQFHSRHTWPRARVGNFFFLKNLLSDYSCVFFNTCTLRQVLSNLHYKPRYCTEIKMTVWAPSNKSPVC